MTSDNGDVFAVLALPNLWISPYHVLTEPAAKGALTVTLTVANTGGVAANDVLLRLAASDPLSGTLLLEETIPAIAAGSSVELIRRVSGLQSDQKEIYIWINPELTVQESSYGDNLVSITIRISSRFTCRSSRGESSVHPPGTELGRSPHARQMDL